MMKGRKNILLIGQGGREHALAWALAASPHLAALFVMPGSDAISALAQSVPTPEDGHEGIARFCRAQDIDLVVIGPEQPLIEGLGSFLEREGIAVFGPSQSAAQLEGSKGFTRDLCAQRGVPAPAYARFEDATKAKDYIQKQPFPLVLKADGIAAGKGVFIAADKREALDALKDIMGGKFGEKNRALVIEEFLEGEEASFFVLADGKNALPLASAQDHKRLLDGDRGPNTGGMGAYSPAPIMTNAMEEKVMQRIILPVLQEMEARGAPYKGVLFAGLMIVKGEPHLLEFNVRFGDPECQALMMRLQSDLLPLLFAAATGDLQNQSVRWKEDAAITIVMAAKGYPAQTTQSPIGSLEKAQSFDNVRIFHAATRQNKEGWIASGGRVLNITALAHNVTQAAKLAYDALSHIEWSDAVFRRDIGARAITQERAQEREQESESENT